MSSFSDPTLCVFANFFIDNEERLQRMKDSFLSFREVNPKEWRINIRGRLKVEAGEFLHRQIGKTLTLFFLETTCGWFCDSREVIKGSSSNYVLFWIEDHLCVTNPDDIRQALKEMLCSGADQLVYSWYHDGVRKKYELIDPIFCGETIRVWKLDKENSKKIRRILQKDFYIVSAVSIMRLDFFIRILLLRRPYLRRWPSYLPFDFEKLSKDNVAEIIYTALPEKELFAAIDDDHGQANYSLISRGLYPNRINRVELKQLESDEIASGRFNLKSLIPDILKPAFSSVYYLLRRLGYSLDRLRIK